MRRQCCSKYARETVSQRAGMCVCENWRKMPNSIREGDGRPGKESYLKTRGNLSGLHQLSTHFARRYRGQAYCVTQRPRSEDGGWEDLFRTSGRTARQRLRDVDKYKGTHTLKHNSINTRHHPQHGWSVHFPFGLVPGCETVGMDTCLKELCCHQTAARAELQKIHEGGTSRSNNDGFHHRCRRHTLMNSSRYLLFSSLSPLLREGGSFWVANHASRFNNSKLPPNTKKYPLAPNSSTPQSAQPLTPNRVGCKLPVSGPGLRNLHYGHWQPRGRVIETTIRPLPLTASRAK